MNTSLAIPTGSDSLTEQAVGRIRAAILSGDLAPGAKLRIQGLCDRFSYSATPVREALSRLVATRLIEAIDQRGFRVRALSYDDLLDIQRMRQLVEPEALRLAIEKGDASWEAEIRSSLQALLRFKANADDQLPEGVEAFDQAHKRFHTALLAACGSPRLLASHSDLHDQVYRYRTVLGLAPRRGQTPTIDHRHLAQLVLSRSSGLAVETLRQHIHLTEKAFLEISPKAPVSRGALARTSRALQPGRAARAATSS